MLHKFLTAILVLTTVSLNAMDLVSDIESQSEIDSPSFEQLKKTFKEYDTTTILPLLKETLPEDMIAFESWFSSEYDHGYQKELENKMFNDLEKITLSFSFAIGLGILGLVIYKASPASSTGALLIELLALVCFYGGAYYTKSRFEKSEENKYIKFIQKFLDKHANIEISQELRNLEDAL